MAKDDWLKALTILGGIALLAKILEEANKNNNQIYRCWNCNYIISKGTSICPNCHSHQNWRGLK